MSCSCVGDYGSCIRGVSESVRFVVDRSAGAAQRDGLPGADQRRRDELEVAVLAVCLLLRRRGVLPTRVLVRAGQAPAGMSGARTQLVRADIRADWCY